MLDFRFSNEQGGRNLDATANLLVQPRLWIPGGDYPAYSEWRDKALDELNSGRKRAMVAYWGSEEVGSIVYQKHPTDVTSVEIRNISVEKAARGRHIASFLLRQVECEAAFEFPGATRITCDTKRTNSGLLAFALHEGYRIEGITKLDESTFEHNGVEDVILAKSLPFPD